MRHITEEDATLQYKTECRICPEIDCDIVAYLPEDTDVTLTCWTDKGQIIIDDPYETKSRQNRLRSSADRVLGITSKRPTIVT